MSQLLCHHLLHMRSHFRIPAEHIIVLRRIVFQIIQLVGFKIVRVLDRSVIAQVPIARVIRAVDRLHAVKVGKFSAPINPALNLFRIAHGNIFPLLGFHGARMAHFGKENFAHRRIIAEHGGLQAHAIERIIGRRLNAGHIQQRRHHIDIRSHPVILPTGFKSPRPLHQHRHAHAVIMKRGFTETVIAMVRRKNHQRVFFQPQLFQLVHDRADAVIQPQEAALVFGFSSRGISLFHILARRQHIERFL